MLLDKNNSALLLIDVQEKLTPLTHDHARLIENCQWLLKAAQKLEIPTLISEQYPKGLGSTLPALLAAAPQHVRVEKQEFSCARNEACFEAIDALNCNQLILIGIEAHVCMLQTAIDLAEEDFDVYVVADCVSSRNIEDKALALARMKEAQIQIISREMAFFEWVETSALPEFRALSQEFLK